jgi:hypothetical protein
VGRLALRPFACDGTALTIASAKPARDEVVATSNTRYFRFLTESDGGQLSDIAVLVDAAKIKPVIGRVFPFNNIVDAGWNSLAG